MADQGADDASYSALAGSIITRVSTELWIVRHGAVDRDHLGADPPLSVLGHDQAKAMAAALSGARELAWVTAVHCSPMRRTVQTAEPLAAALGVPLMHHDGLAEYDRDAPEYLLLADLRARGDVRFDQVMAGDLTAYGTDWPTFRNRVLASVRDVVAAVDGIGVVVSHGGPINALLGVALGIDQRRWLTIPDNASLTRIGVAADGRLKVLSVNETWYLRPGQ